jgi:hypothetical protein
MTTPDNNTPDAPQTSHIESQLDSIIATLNVITSAFPMVDGKVDVEGHRKYHEAMIAAATEQAEFWRELKLDLAKKGTFALIIIVLGLIATGVLVKLGIYHK